MDSSIMGGGASDRPVPSGGLDRRDMGYMALILLAGLLRFVNLGFRDMQAWDEGLYAMRSIGILRFGGWLDQSPFAVDGLYSALHPPLYVWLSAISIELFGLSEFAIRFPSALLAGLTLPTIYLIGRRLGGREVGVIGALLYGLNPFVNFYARQGQFDSALVFFLSLAILFLLRAEQHGATGNAIAAGAAIGAALMCKLFVGFGVPAAYLVWMIAAGRIGSRRNWLVLGVSVTVALLIAAPWHIMITLRHGGEDPFFLLNASQMFERVVYGIEGNEKSLELFYFINQLLVLFPLGVAWFAYGAIRMIRERGSSWLLLFIWFALFFVVFSVMRTKLEFYLLPMLAPAALIAAGEIRRAMLGQIPRRSLALLVGATAIALVWAASQSWRLLTKEVLGSIVSFRLPVSGVLVEYLPFALLLLASIGLTLVFWSGRISPRVVRALPVILFAPAFVLCSHYALVEDRERYDNGGLAFSQFVHRENIGRLVVAGFERNPQISYYLDGVDVGWRDDITFRRIDPPADSALFATWIEREWRNEPDSTLFVVESDRFLRGRKILPSRIVPVGYSLVFDSPRYSAYRRAGR